MSSFERPLDACNFLAIGRFQVRPGSLPEITIGFAALLLRIQASVLHSSAMRFSSLI